MPVDFRDIFTVSRMDRVGFVLCIVSDEAAHLAQELARWSLPHGFSAVCAFETCHNRQVS